MAVFADVGAPSRRLATRAEEVATIDVDGYDPRCAPGSTSGRPRKLGGDYLGVAVNVAARVAEAAKAGEVLISETRASGSRPTPTGCASGAGSRPRARPTTWPCTRSARAPAGRSGCASRQGGTIPRT